MQSLAEWAARWGIPDQALDELGASVQYSAAEVAGKVEASVLSAVRLEAARKNVFLWRNNNGAGKLESGDFIRWGLANDSKRLNTVLKSSDLIGIRRHMVMPGDVGSFIGRFVARECKKAGWKYSGTPEEQAQLRFITLVNRHGGDASFTTSEGSL